MFFILKTHERIFIQSQIKSCHFKLSIVEYCMAKIFSISSNSLNKNGYTRGRTQNQISSIACWLTSKNSNIIITHLASVTLNIVTSPISNYGLHLFGVKKFDFITSLALSIQIHTEMFTRNDFTNRATQTTKYNLDNMIFGHNFSFSFEWSQSEYIDTLSLYHGWSVVNVIFGVGLVRCT